MTAKESLTEAQNYFGVRVYANDDGVTERIELRAMKEYAKQKCKEQRSNCSKAIMDKSWNQRMHYRDYILCATEPNFD